VAKLAGLVARRESWRPRRSIISIPRRCLVSEHVYKTIELIGSSPVSPDEAIRRAITRAGETVRNLRWFQVTDTRGHLEDGKIAHWQVTLKVGFTLED
jgi:flavin-binding protein dodecin